MSQEPRVLLVDLPDKSTAFTQALAQVGRSAVAVTLDQLPTQLDSGKPLGIVAHSDSVPQIAKLVRERDYPVQLPLFALQDEKPGSIRPPLPEVTAVVPVGVEPGILALRIQQSLQQVGGPRPRQATVLGMGSMSQPPTVPSKPPEMPQAAAPVSAPAKPVENAPSKPPASSAPKPPVSAPPKPPEVPWDPSPPDEASPNVASPSASERPRGVVSSAPPIPEIEAKHASSPKVPAHPPVPGAADPARGDSPTNSPQEAGGAAATLGAPTGAAPAGAAPNSQAAPPAPGAKAAVDATAAPTHPPVALSAAASAVASPTASEPDFRRGQSPWLRRGLAVAGVVAVLGVGATLLSGSGDEEQSAAADDAEGKSAGDAAAQAAEGSKPAEAEEKPSPDATKKAEQEAEEQLAGAEPPDEAEPKVEGEGQYFVISEPSTFDSCEKVLGKSRDDYASRKKWQAISSWKQSRRSLMAGNEETALKQMCESAFIDPSGPASVGLAKYYLGKRALEEAHAWAERAVESAKGASSKRSAQQVLGDVFSQMGKVNEARALWLESFNLTEEQTDRLGPVCRNFLNAAVKARKGGDPALAEHLLRRVVTFQPDNAAAAAVLASTLLENEQPELAKKWAQRALDEKPGLDMAEEVLEKLD